MDDKTLCPLCGEGNITPRTESMQTEYRGQQGMVTLRYAECDACGSEITGDADGRANKRAVVAFRKTVDGLLTGGRDSRLAGEARHHASSAKHGSIATTDIWRF
jgi:HTH-type transcriptional regulator/antitoxin MqsA